MAVRIYFEIGHEASIRNKKTQEGFTHDWEVFVRGCDGAEIHYFVEKVVFYLHETFPKPKRVVKEPPYSVKESGYAGFNLPIDVYLRNNNEPKKIRFNYDLHLQNVGPPIINVLKEKYVFTSTTDDFKSKLLKGGGTIGNSSNLQEFNDSRTSLDDKNQMTNKPKLSGCDIIRKQTKTGEPSREFNAIFGSPIFTSKTTVDVKQQLQPKPDSKSVEKNRMKHSPQKDSHRDKDKKERADSKNKDEKKLKEKSKDRERSSKDKTLKKDRSPRPKSPSPRSRSPKSPARFSSPSGTKHKDLKSHDKRDKPDERKPKKEKRSKEHKHGDEQKLNSDKHKENKVRATEKKEIPKIKIDPPTSPKVEKKEKNKDKSLPKEIPKDEKSSDKSYSSEKYKHKKKDKEKREKKEEKPHKSEKKAEIKPNLFKTEPQMAVKKEKPFSQPPVTIDDSSSSSSFSSSSSERNSEKKTKSETKSMKDEKNLKFKKERNYQESSIKCKRKSNSVEADEPPEKMSKDHSNNNSDAEEEEDLPEKTFIVKNEVEEDYFGVLRDLQHKIMGLKDNEDLQKVVQLIAETGRYEVSAHTFDFDLCLLDRSTVKQLQDFFTNET